jgi:hypothetical protein
MCSYYVFLAHSVTLKCPVIVNDKIICKHVSCAAQVDLPILLMKGHQLKFVIWNRHGHECSRIWKWSGNFTLIQCIKKCRDFLGRNILGTTFFRAESSLIQSSCRSFIRVSVPYEISKVNFRVETKILVSMSEEI